MTTATSSLFSTNPFVVPMAQDFSVTPSMVLNTSVDPAQANPSAAAGEYKQTLYNVHIWSQVVDKLKTAVILSSDAGTGSLFRQEYLFTSVPPHLSRIVILSHLTLFKEHKQKKGIGLKYGFIYYHMGSQVIHYAPVETYPNSKLLSLPETIEMYGDMESTPLQDEAYIIGIYVIVSSDTYCKHHQFQYMKWGMVSVCDFINQMYQFALQLDENGISLYKFLENVPCGDWLFVPESNYKVPTVTLQTTTGVTEVNNCLVANKKSLHKIGSGKVFTMHWSSIFTHDLGGSVSIRLSRLITKFAKPNLIQAPTPASSVTSLLFKDDPVLFIKVK